MRGVTLLELMVVVVIIGILFAIAYPGYQSQIQKTRRAEGKALLLDTAQRLERCFTKYNSYNNAGCDIATSLGGGIASDSGWYLVTDAAPAASTFSLVATRQNAQTGDTLCGNLTLTDRGVRGTTGTAPVDTCW
jgi:type IV pilus assembly protein PilE